MARFGVCRVAGLVAGHSPPPAIAWAAVGNGTAGPCLHPADKGSGTACAALRRSRSTTLDGTVPNLNGLGGERGEAGRGTAPGLPHSHPADKEWKPGALSGKSSEMARAELATSHWIKNTLSSPKFISSLLPLTYYDCAKLSGFSFTTVKSHQPSAARVGDCSEIKELGLLCLNCPRGDRPRDSRQGGALNAPSPGSERGANAIGTRWRRATSLLSFATRLVR